MMWKQVELNQREKHVDKSNWNCKQCTDTVLCKVLPQNNAEASVVVEQKSRRMSNLMSSYNSNYSLRCDKMGKQIQCFKTPGSWLRVSGRSVNSSQCSLLSRSGTLFALGIIYYFLQNSDMEGSMFCWSLKHTVF